jgi:glycosyltransferase involved in cell wall biosynthesis
MNIVVVADSASISGGMQKCAVWSAIGLAQRGHSVTYLAGYGPIDPAFAVNPGVRVVCPEYEERPARHDRGDAMKRVFGNPEMGQAMKEILADLSPQDTVVHCHDVDRIVTMRPIEVAMKRGFPVVMTLHTYGLSCPSGSFFNFSTSEQCSLTPMSFACLRSECTGHGRATKAGHVAKFMVNRYRSGIPTRLRHIVCVSEFSKRINLPHLPREADVRVIANHVDLLPGPRVEAERNRPFTYVGRLVPEKGPEVLARAARLLGVPVKFVGDGPEKERVLAANPEAEVTGWIAPAQVHEELAEARALCMVSRWNEG